MRPSAALQLADLPPQLPLAVPLFLARERRSAALEQLVAPRVEERVRDLMLAADLLHRAVAAQPRQHDRDLLLGRPAPVLPLLAQPRLLLRRAAHAEPGAGRSLRGSARSETVRHSKSATCQRGAGERGNVALVPGTGARFEVRLDRETIWSREAQAGFPDLVALKRLVRDRIAAAASALFGIAAALLVAGQLLHVGATREVHRSAKRQRTIPRR